MGKCPRCSKEVYLAEEVRAGGNSWHKRCFTCADCNKGLDSANLREHNGNVYCTSCHGKLFGPKGYGFAGGAAGLSMDTGNANEVTRQNVPVGLSQAQVPSTLGSTSAGSKNTCPVCNKAVYMAEKILGPDSQAFHKLCFKCSSCRKMLDSTTMANHQGTIFCKSCYGKSYGPKGYGFAGGAAGLSMDTGNPNKITTENIPAGLSQAQVPKLISSEPTVAKSPNTCPVCHKAVYIAEKVVGPNAQAYHKMCFKCSECRKMLDSTTMSHHGETIYCKACYSKHHGPKGFGFGAALHYTE